MSFHDNVTCNGTAIVPVDTARSFQTWSFVTIAIIGSLGNLLVCLALIIDRKIRKVSYYLICQLAFVDLLVCSIILPFDASRVFDKQSGLCHLYTALSGIIPGISIHYQCYVSVNRYCLTTKPMHFYHKWFSHKVAQVTLTFIVAINVSVTLAVFGFVPLTFERTFACGCLEIHKDQRQWIHRTLTISAIISFLIGICLYLKLLRYIRGSELTEMAARETQISKILAILLTAYFISMVLSPIIFYVFDRYRFGEWVGASISVLLCLNYAVNPMVYGLSVFKQTFIRTLSHCCKFRKIEPIT